MADFCAFPMLRLLALLTVPFEVITEILPAVVPGITMATKIFPLLDIGIAETPPILTLVKLFKPIPVMVTRLPTEAVSGVKEVIAGVENWIKFAFADVFKLLNKMKYKNSR